jgi:hypothetical protein
VKGWEGSVMVWAAISWYTILLVPLLYFIADYVDRSSTQVHPIIFPNDPVSKQMQAFTQLHFPWPPQSPDLNMTEQLWSVLETRGRSRFLPVRSLKQLEDVPQEEWYNIPLQTVQNVYESIPRKIAVQRHINEGQCKVSVVFPLL